MLHTYSQSVSHAIPSSIHRSSGRRTTATTMLEHGAQRLIHSYTSVYVFVSSDVFLYQFVCVCVLAKAACTIWNVVYPCGAGMSVRCCALCALLHAICVYLYGYVCNCVRLVCDLVVFVCICMRFVCIYVHLCVFVCIFACLHASVCIGVQLCVVACICVYYYAFVCLRMHL